MKKQGSELEFISWIRRDGSGTDPVKPDHIKVIQTESFEVSALSLSNKTFIAHGFNSFVVKLRPELPKDELPNIYVGYRNDERIRMTQDIVDQHHSLPYDTASRVFNAGADHYKKLVEEQNKNLTLENERSRS